MSMELFIYLFIVTVTCIADLWLYFKYPYQWENYLSRFLPLSGFYAYFHRNN